MIFNPKALINAAIAALVEAAESAAPGHKPQGRLPSVRALLRSGVRREFGGAKAHRAVFVAEGNQANNRIHASSQIRQTGGGL